MATLGLRSEALGDRLLIYADDGEAVLARHDLIGRPSSVFIRRATLEDVFLALTGRALDES